MYRAHAGPPPPDPYEAGRQNARNCGWLQIGSIAVTTLTIGGFVLRAGAIRLPPGLDPADVSAFKHAALAGSLGYVLVMGFWAALNCWGLSKRWKLAYVSSFGFAVASILSCLPAVFGGVLLFLLLKPEMKGYFGPRPSS